MEKLNNMKHSKILFLNILLVIFVFEFITFRINIDAISAASYILMDGNSGRVLLKENSERKMHMASTTKIMTAILALESGKLNEKIVITKNMTNIEGCSIHLIEGEELTLEELVYAVMLDSANDASIAIAIQVAGSVAKFVELMNKKAREIGAFNTKFQNPNGLGHDQHYTTSYDLALITRYGYNNVPKFQEIASTKYYKIPYNNAKNQRQLKHHNKMLWTYKDCCGVKTGFIKSAGRCLVSAANRNDLLLISVTLNDPDDWQDHTQLLDYGFNNYCSRKFLCKDESIVHIWNDQEVLLKVKDNLSISLKKNEMYNTKVVYKINSNLSDYKKGDVIGKAEIRIGDNAESSVDLTLDQNLSKFSYTRTLFNLKSTIKSLAKPINLVQIGPLFL